MQEEKGLKLEASVGGCMRSPMNKTMPTLDEEILG